MSANAAKDLCVYAKVSSTSDGKKELETTNLTCKVNPIVDHLSEILPKRKENLLTLQIVRDYIKSFYEDVTYLKTLTISDPDDFCTFIHSLQPPTTNTQWPNKTLEQIKETFKKQDEDNQLSLAFEAYMVFKNKRTLDQKTQILSDIHDGWALARLITTQKNKQELPIKLACNFKTNQYETYNLTLNIDSEEQDDILTKILNYDSQNKSDHSKLLKSILITINFDSNNTTVIRGDQLKMMVPYINLVQTDKNKDESFYTANFSDVEKLKTTINTIAVHIPLPKANGAAGGGRKHSAAKRNGGSASCKGPMQTQKRVLIGGKSRVVYQGKRGGEYIKKGGEFMSLVKAIKGI